MVYKPKAQVSPQEKTAKSENNQPKADIPTATSEPAKNVEVPKMEPVIVKSAPVVVEKKVEEKKEASAVVTIPEVKQAPAKKEPKPKVEKKQYQKKEKVVEKPAVV